MKAGALYRAVTAARPGDPRGGYLAGQTDELQKLPGGDKGHGGEFVVNAGATRAFRPLLELMNRMVAPPDVKADRSRVGRSYFVGGETGEDPGPAGPSSTGDVDDALTALTAPPADDPSQPGFGIGNPPPPGPPTYGPDYAFSGSPTGLVGHQPGMPGFSPAGPPGNTGPSTGFTVSHDIMDPNDPVAMAVRAVADQPLSFRLGNFAAGMTGIPSIAPPGTNPAPAAIAALTGMPGFSAVVGGMTAAAQGDVMTAAHTLGISPEDAASLLGAATTAPDSGGQSGGEDGDGTPRRQRPPTLRTIPLRDYLAWVRRATQGRTG